MGKIDHVVNYKYRNMKSEFVQGRSRTVIIGRKDSEA